MVLRSVSPKVQYNILSQQMRSGDRMIEMDGAQSLTDQLNTNSSDTPFITIANYNNQ